MRLFCFPYAGGGSQIYRNFSQALPPQVEVCALLLPGRERRFAERPFDSVQETVEQLWPVLRPQMALPYALIGHSLGALVAYELAQRARREGAPTPAHLYACAHRAPQLPDPDPPIHDLPRDEFVQALARLNGTPSEILESKELLDLLLPMIRADITAAETYRYTEEPALACPITAFAGRGDSIVSEPEVQAWRERTANAFTYRVIDGAHFFIQDNVEEVLGVLCGSLNDDLSAADERS